MPPTTPPTMAPVAVCLLEVEVEVELLSLPLSLIEGMATIFCLAPGVQEHYDTENL